MATRLPIVISSHPNRGSQHSDHEESLVAELLFTDRLDATLVGSLESIAEDGTDGLCLEGLKGDFAILTWLPHETVSRELTRLNIAGNLIWIDGDNRQILPLAETGENDPNGHKRVYHFPLKHSQSVQQTIAALKTLLESKSTMTFSIQPPPGQSKSNSPTVINRNDGATAGDFKPLPITKSANPEPPKPTPLTQPTILHTDANITADEIDDSIDQLFDDFENSDF